jgi:phosphate transport system substrate-binding protein
MKKMHRNLVRWLSAFILIAILLTACGGGATQTTAPQPEATEPAGVETEVMTGEPTDARTEEPSEAMTEEATGGEVLLPEVDPAEATGAIVTAGSSTVFPLAEAMAARFGDEGYADEITIDSIGSGAGFERFCVAGETDIANASRAIRDTEIESCQSIGREPIEFRVGTDALAVVVSTENDFLTDLTLEQLALVYSTAETWADVDPAWPAEPIQRFSPGTDSGTFDFFVEAVMNVQYPDAGEDQILASNPQLSEDDNVLVQGVEGSPYAIGYFGYAYYQENADRLKILSIEGVEPSFETAESGAYVLSRPLYIYSDATLMNEKPQVAAFINFFLTFVNEEIEEVGYFPASEAALNEAKQKWLDAIQ